MRDLTVIILQHPYRILRTVVPAVVSAALLIAAAPPVFAAADPTFTARVEAVIRQFDADVEADRGFSAVLAGLLREEYRTPQSELYWASAESVSWGRIAVLSYLRATTGRAFEELAGQGADRDVADFVARMEMSPDSMLQSLESLARMAVRERNSRIFDRLRSARTFTGSPDLGAGFGLFQESLEFRQLGTASPTKVHTGPAFLVKGDGGQQ